MKKLLLLFTMAAVAVMTGCVTYGDHYYASLWRFHLNNQTDYEICFVADGDFKDCTYPGMNLRFALIEGDKVLDCVPLGDLFHEDEIMRPNYNWGPTNILQIQIDGELMPDIIFQRKYWTFVSHGSHWASYTLTVTEELIETIKNQ